MGQSQGTEHKLLQINFNSGRQDVCLKHWQWKTGLFLAPITITVLVPLLYSYRKRMHLISLELTEYRNFNVKKKNNNVNQLVTKWDININPFLDMSTTDLCSSWLTSLNQVNSLLTYVQVNTLFNKLKYAMQFELKYHQL